MDFPEPRGSEEREAAWRPPLPLLIEAPNTYGRGCPINSQPRRLRYAKHLLCIRRSALGDSDDSQLVTQLGWQDFEGASCIEVPVQAVQAVQL